MRAVRATVAATVAAAVLPAGASAQTTAPSERTGEVIVRFAGSAGAAERVDARQEAEVRAVRGLEVDGAQLVEPEPGVSVDAAIARLEAHPEVLYAEPDHVVLPMATMPDDPRFADGSLWGLHSTSLSRSIFGGIEDADIDAPEAWDLTTGSAEVVVAVADTGIRRTHPDLAARTWTNPGEVGGNGQDDDGNGKVDDVHGWNFVRGTANTDDTSGHGTHVAGTIGATGDNGMGIAGVGWRTTLMAVKVLDPSGTDASVADGFAYAADEGADVVNASLGGAYAPTRYLTDIIRARPGTLFVIAAGNDSSDNDVRPVSPCNVDAPNVVCVAATNASDRKAGFSNVGARTVDLGAPGVDIVSASIDATDTLLSDLFNSDTIASHWTTTGTWSVRTATPGNNYVETAEDDATLATTDSFDLDGRTGCRLSFNYATASTSNQVNGDGIRVDHRIGDGAWTRTGFYFPKTFGRWKGVATTHFPADDDVRLRFRVVTSNGETTVRIDEPRLACDGVLDGDAVATFSGTSMAAPHVAGAAGLLLAARPSATVAEVRAALLDHGDPVADLQGRTVTGRRLNVDRSLRAIAVRPPTLTAGAAEGGSVIAASGFTDPLGGDGQTCTIDFGDGTGAQPGVVADGACTAAHVFLEDGTYHVTTTVSAPDGRTSSATAPHDVEPAPATDRRLTGVGKLGAGAGAGGPAFRMDLGARDGALTADLPAGRLTATGVEWLVPDDGRLARAKGSAALGDRTGLRFVAVALDGNGGGTGDDGPRDRLRLRVWDPATGEELFDSQAGGSLAAVPPPVHAGRVDVEPAERRRR